MDRCACPELRLVTDLPRSPVTPAETMVVVAARTLTSADVCFVGIGHPSTAGNLARLTHAPDISLIYESGPIDTAPDVLPLSIGDGELADTALTTVSIPEMFRYWLQGGRIDVGFLGGAQIDRFGNINSTTIGGYASPAVRLPGAGGAPEIATHSRRVYVIMRHSPRSMVAEVDFITTLGHGRDGNARTELGLTTAGPVQLITDLCVMAPGADNAFEVVALHPGVTRARVVEQTGWPVRFADDVDETAPPTGCELTTLRQLHDRTAAAHRG